MSDPRRVEPLARLFDVDVAVPGSKSLTNRALLCAALAEGSSELTGVLFADDTEAMLGAVQKLGAHVDVDRSTRTIRVEGNGGRLTEGPVELDARASGTTARFLLPMVANGRGSYVLRGDPALVARPMHDGVAILRDLGVRVESADGHLPVTIEGGISGDKAVTVPGDVSSQFLSGVLLAAPTWPGGRRVTVLDDLVSRPYVEMTVAVMRAFGAVVDEGEPGQWRVGGGGGYKATMYSVEPDASAASYFFAAAAICGGRVRVAGLDRNSKQGDLRFAEILEQMGAAVSIGDDDTTVEGTGQLTGVTVDMTDFSDTAQTLAVTAAFADTATRITGIGFIRAKETDRIGAVVRELRRCGIRAEEEPDGLVVHPSTPHGAVVETYGDHRMAMSFALLGLRVPGISIADPTCVAKTFPDFFEVLESLRG